MGNLTQMVDALGHITELEYDEMGRLRERTASFSQTISYDYDTAGNVISITDPLGNATTYAYDSANQLAQSTNASAQTTSFERDEMGRVEAITDASDIRTDYTYDSAGYLVATTDGLGRKTEYVYDALGRLTDKIDAAGIVSHYDYDVAGRLAAVSENYRPGLTPDEETNVRTEYTYDDNGNLLTVTDANRNTARSYQYNARNQVTTLTNPLGHTKSYAYTVTDYAYDNSSRLKHHRIPQFSHHQPKERELNKVPNFSAGLKPSAKRAKPFGLKLPIFLALQEFVPDVPDPSFVILAICHSED